MEMKLKRVRASKILLGQKFKTNKHKFNAVYMLTDGVVLGKKLMVCIQGRFLFYTGKVEFFDFDDREYLWRVVE